MVIDSGEKETNDGNRAELHVWQPGDGKSTDSESSLSSSQGTQQPQNF